MRRAASTLTDTARMALPSRVRWKNTMIAAVTSAVHARIHSEVGLKRSPAAWRGWLPNGPSSERGSTHRRRKLSHNLRRFRAKDVCRTAGRELDECLSLIRRRGDDQIIR